MMLLDSILMPSWDITIYKIKYSSLKLEKYSEKLNVQKFIKVTSLSAEILTRS